MIHEFSKVNAFGMGVAGLVRGKLTTSVRNCDAFWGGFPILVGWSVAVNCFGVILLKCIPYCYPYLKNEEFRTIRTHFRHCNGISKLYTVHVSFCCTELLHYNF